jgi:hypothetical protein
MRYQQTRSFANGYGLSIVCQCSELPLSGLSGFLAEMNMPPMRIESYGGARGLFEVAIRGPNGEIDHTNPIGSVIGDLDFGDVARIIARVAALPPKKEDESAHKETEPSADT